MADIADKANKTSDLFLKSALQKASTKPEAFSGFCLSCEEPVSARRYCDKDCRDEHEKSLRKM